MNSWRLGLGEIPTAEMIELQLVNAIAPFVLCNKLSNMMKRENTGQKHIVNVSAMEGKFHRYTKTDKHPHTNMAKAALNMLSEVGRIELADAGVSVSVVYPSVTATEFHQHLRAGRILAGARTITPDPPELAAEAVVLAIRTGAAHVLVADPPRAFTPGGHDGPDPPGTPTRHV